MAVSIRSCCAVHDNHPCAEKTLIKLSSRMEVGGHFPGCTGFLCSTVRHWVACENLGLGRSVRWVTADPLTCASVSLIKSWALTCARASLLLHVLVCDGRLTGAQWSTEKEGRGQAGTWQPIWGARHRGSDVATAAPSADNLSFSSPLRNAERQL